jgi:hypothetical protein
MIKKILFWGLVVLVVIQLIPVNRTNKPVDKKDNFVSIQQSPADVTQLLQRACYDCHSDDKVSVVLLCCAYFVDGKGSCKRHG